MKKKTRNLMIVIGVLALCIAAYFVIIKLAKDEDADAGDTVTDTAFWSFGDDIITGITVEGRSERFEFLYNKDDASWSYPADGAFPVNQTALTSLAASVKALTYSRSISDYTDLSSYCLDAPALKLTYTTDNGNSQVLLFSDIEGSGGTYYFKDEAADIVYLTSTKLYAYADYTLYDYIQLVTIPDLSAYDISSVTFQVSGSDTVKLTVNKEKTEEDGENTVFDYESAASEEKIQANISDTNVMMNYISEFTINEAVNYKPTEEELAEYGLAHPQATVTLEFSGYTSKEIIGESGEATSQLVESEFTYKINIGYPTSDNNAQYYVSVSCVESENENSRYNSNAVYTANAIYAEYYLEMCEDNINGVNSTKERILKEEAIPSVTAENLQSIEFDFYDEAGRKTILVQNNGDGAFEYSVITYADGEIGTISDTAAVTDSAANQLLEYISSSNQLKYVDSVSESKSENMLAKYGLDAPLRTITVAYSAELENGEGNTDTYHMTWALSIGKGTDETENGSYYVTASNSDCIYTMSDSIINYLLAVDEEILNGAEIYGKSDIQNINE